MYSRTLRPPRLDFGAWFTLLRPGKKGNRPWTHTLSPKRQLPVPPFWQQPAVGHGLPCGRLPRLAARQAVQAVGAGGFGTAAFEQWHTCFRAVAHRAGSLSWLLISLGVTNLPHHGGHARRVSLRSGGLVSRSPHMGGNAGRRRRIFPFIAVQKGAPPSKDWAAGVEAFGRY